MGIYQLIEIQLLNIRYKENRRQKKLIKQKKCNCNLVLGQLPLDQNEQIAHEIHISASSWPYTLPSLASR